MLDNELKERLSGAKSLDEVKDLLKEHQGIDAERAWQELEKKRSVFLEAPISICKAKEYHVVESYV